MASSGMYFHRPPGFNYNLQFPLCGCWYFYETKKLYLPLVRTRTLVSVLSSASHTTLEQSFTNSSTAEAISRCTYEFPLYDGVSITSFTCTIGSKKLFGIVNERAKAHEKFEAAVARGETAGLLEQDERASDVFRTVLGNVPRGETVHVHLTYVGELKHDAEVDGLRLTLPSIVAPRYDNQVGRYVQQPTAAPAQVEDMSVTVDIDLAEGSPIQTVESPSHPISVSVGKTSTGSDSDLSLTKGSAALSLQGPTLDKDFVLLIKAKDVNLPKAILERHPTIQDHRAIMTTLVPRFDLPLTQPEVVFIADRSGSMEPNVEMLKKAMSVFLRSMPPGVKFNICSFGNICDFLWKKSQPYTKATLDQATNHVATFESNYGGTETLRALQATVARRYKDLPLDMILLTDGDIWAQEQALAWVGAEVKKSKGQIRVFPLGIGHGVSHSLIEGLARAGNGFAQAVQTGERMENKVVRMLKGALFPHLSEFTLDVVFGDDDDFEMVEPTTENLTIRSQHFMEKGKDKAQSTGSASLQPTISLFDPSTDPLTTPKESKSSAPDLPKIPVPKLLQAPSTIPALYPFVRTTAYLLLSPSTLQRNPQAVILRANSQHGPLELRIPIEVLEEPGTTVHCLAARKSVQDLEENRGWLHEAKNESGKLLSEILPSKFQDLVQQEAVRLGETFQIANRWCSFVAVEANDKEEARKRKDKMQDREFEENSPTYDAHETGLKVAKFYGDSGIDLHCRLGRTSTRKRKSATARNWSTNPLVPARASCPSISMACMMASGLPEGDGSLFGAPPQDSSQPGPLQLQVLAGPPVGAFDRGYSSQSASTGFADGVSKACFGMKRTYSFGRRGSNKLSEEQHMKESKEEPPVPLTDADRVLRIISLQEFDGHWQASRDLASLIEEDGSSFMVLSDMTVTEMVLRFLEQRMSQEKNVWEMVVEKARAWLQESEANVARVREEAKKWEPCAKRGD